eukprot:TRINITY_DN43906_c0_g1_i1.p1 TRINITY_DN43906_c0_g1~~TRINITY_DN43906_c0_g1_i1.p1  ORF type:complete len:694 (-),score=82.97 TRINITY_DN43906_c0_g1_i1:76-1887(-)
MPVALPASPPPPSSSPPSFPDASPRATGSLLSRRVVADVSDTTTDVYYVTEMLDKLKVLTQLRANVSESRQDRELARLNAALQRSVTPSDKAALMASIHSIAKARVEAHNASNEMYKFYYTIKAALGARGGLAPSCSVLQCGENAECRMGQSTMLGTRETFESASFGSVAPSVSGGGSAGTASCVCKNCFQGDGFDCRPSACGSPAYHPPRPLPMHRGEKTATSLIADIHVAVFSENCVAIVHRDASVEGRGFLQLGTVGERDAMFGPLYGFSGDFAAFAPVVTALDNGRLLIAYRDEDRAGDGFVVSGEVKVPFGANRSYLEAVLQRPRRFARGQSQRMVALPFAGSRVVVLYSGHIPPSATSTAQSFGGAFFVQISQGGSMSILGKYRFARNRRVSRLAATLLTPTSMVVAYRALPAGTVVPGGKSQELSAIWMGMRDEELVLGQKALELEPGRREMWNRDLALVSENLVAYSYQSGTEKRTKVAMIRVDPMSNRLFLASGPDTLHKGDAEFVQAVSLAAGQAEPRTLTFFQRPGHTSKAAVCSVLATGQLSSCSEAAWVDNRFSCASASRLKDGRLFVAYADEKKSPWWQALSVQEFATG